MHLQDDTVTSVSSHLEQILRRLPVQTGERLIELGCGRAETTRQVAKRFPGLRIIATEVDSRQHARNEAIDDLPNVSFRFGGAEKIELPDESVNYVMMLKSLHHVPMPLMKQSLNEIRRVLVPGGLAYLAEPVYAGTFNDILKLFNDEQVVREAAFAAVRESVESGAFELVGQFFFLAPMRFDGFAEFHERVMNATHSSYKIDNQLHETIKAAFEQVIDSSGAVEFLTPQRVDLLRRPDR